jgi:transposase InsO family protein
MSRKGTCLDNAVIENFFGITFWGHFNVAGKDKFESFCRCGGKLCEAF